MKRVIFFIVFVALNAASNTYGQGFFDKLNKGLDKVNKGIDKGLNAVDQGVDKVLNPNQTTQAANLSTSEAYRGVTIKSFSPKVGIALESCIRDGNTITITYYLTNNGPDLTFSNLGTGRTIINPDDETLVIDNQGKRYEVKYNELGVDVSTTFKISIPTGIRLKGVIEIGGVDPRAKQFQLVNMAGLIPLNSSQFKPFSYSFRNIPIFTLDETLAMLNPTVIQTVNNPSVSRSVSADSKMESVTITDKYTRVDCVWRNTQFNPEGTIFAGDMGSNYLEVNGQKFMLLQFSGISAHKDETWIKYGQTVSYTMIYEPVPANTSSFDLVGDGLDFFGVKMVEEVAALTAKTDLQKANLKGRVKSVAEKNGTSQIDTYKYNENGMLLSVEYKDLTKSAYPRSGSIICTYNDRNLLSTKVVRVATNGQINFLGEALRLPQNCTYSYDQSGRLLKCYDSHDKSTILYEYNAKGQLSKEAKTASGAKFSDQLYLYDNQGNLTTVYLDKISEYPLRTYKYDTKGRVVEEYDGDETYKITYNDKDDPTSRSYLDFEGNARVDNFYYTYDAQGNWTKKVYKDKYDTLIYSETRVIEYYLTK